MAPACSRFASWGSTRAAEQPWCCTKASDLAIREHFPASLDIWLLTPYADMCSDEGWKLLGRLCLWHAASLVCVLPSFARARLDTSKCVWLGFILFKLQIAGSCCHKNRGKFAWLPETSAYPNYLLFSAVWNSSTYLGEKQRCREQERATARALRPQLNLLNTAPNVELHICLGWCPWDDQNRRNSGR